MAVARILFQNRADAEIAPGGDTVQMHKTRLALQDAGFDVDISLEPEPALAGYDLVHVFNIQTSEHGLRQCRNAAQQGVPLAVSTIFWELGPTRTDVHRLIYGPSAPLRAIARALPQMVAPLWRMVYTAVDRRWQKSALPMLQLADVLLPNSHAETEALVHHFAAPWIRCKSVVVPNGTDTTGASGAHADLPAALAEIPQPYVLEVGRIQPVKNQLRLIEALVRDPTLPLVFVGRPAHREYTAACREAGARRGNTWFIDELPQSSLPAIYLAAKVHALPSLGETTGLVTLEAAYHGANCVVSHHGPVGEYFDGLAWCCDPLDLISIRSAVLNAWASPHRLELGKRVRQQFTWAAAALSTIAAYRRIGVCCADSLPITSIGHAEGISDG